MIVISIYTESKDALVINIAVVVEDISSTLLVSSTTLVFGLGLRHESSDAMMHAITNVSVSTCFICRMYIRSSCEYL
jgi:hypothetical protein